MDVVQLMDGWNSCQKHGNNWQWLEQMLLLDNQFDTNAFMSILGPKLVLKVNYRWVSNYLKTIVIWM